MRGTADEQAGEDLSRDKIQTMILFTLRDNGSRIELECKTPMDSLSIGVTIQ